MRTIGHKTLARYLIAQYNEVKRAKKLAFTLGCIEPDINVFTHLTASKKRNGVFDGHNYPVTENKILKMLDRLSRKRRKNSIVFWYRLGKLVHYVTDAFTYPHSPAFDGSVSEHVKYEHEFHDYFTARITDDTENGTEYEPAFETFTVLHEKYLSEIMSCRNDYAYIIASTAGAMHACV